MGAETETEAGRVTILSKGRDRTRDKEPTSRSGTLAKSENDCVIQTKPASSSILRKALTLFELPSSRDQPCVGGGKPVRL